MNSNLKRLLAVAAAIILTVSAVSAQFRFGIKAGANFNSLHFTDVPSNFSKDNGAGFTGGVMTEFQVPVIGLCFDLSLMYTRMNAEILGTTAGDNLTESDLTSSKSRNFFEIPLNVKYKIGLPVVSSIITPYVFTGPSFAFKLGGDKDVFETKTFQCAWNVGIGVELIRHLQVSGSYGFGMNNVFKSVAGINTTNDLKLKNNYWTVTAAWLF